MRLVVTGGSGQLARDLVSAAEKQAVGKSLMEVIALPRSALDITNVTDVKAMLADHRPDAVINTAAYHQVDLCESEPEQSFLVNAAAPQRLAAACERAESRPLLLHISTDYVFDGAKREPYQENDPIGPLSVYAASKAAGELAVRAATDHHILVRTTGLYGLGGRVTGRGNFVETMLRLGKERSALSVVGDQVLTPSGTSDVAAFLLALVEAGVHGTYHVTNSGACSWYEFAAEIFRLAGISVDLTPTTQAERPLPARRPAYSVLAHHALHRLGLPEPRPWQESLAAYLHSRAAR